jgi:uncharacterized protein (TIGR03086 family)
MRQVGRRPDDAAMTESRPTHTERPSLAELLMTFGRDREAVEVATRDWQTEPTTTPGGSMDGAQQLDELMPVLHALVDEITNEQLTTATLCTKFSVADVLEHMIGGAAAFAPAFRGQASPPAAAVTSGSLQDRWRAAMADLLDAVHTSGAAERTIAAPFGDVPGAVFARFVAFDGLVHGWDIATAAGLSYAPSHAVVAAADGFARQALTDDLRDGDTFATAVTPPADAHPLERVVAFSGRTIPRNKPTKTTRQ